MIFVSYAHEDEKWRRRFEQISKPMSRVASIEFWSDKKLKGGQWEVQIEAAMARAEATVLLVSPAFLASDYIMQKELPYFINAHKERGLIIFWAYLEPCDLKWSPEIKKFQAMTLNGQLNSLASLTDWQWKQVMVNGCGMIDEFIKTLEKPIINTAIKNSRLQKRTDKFPLLEKPARRNVEVLVYSSDKKWWRQPPVKQGLSTTTIYLGDDKTKQGSSFRIVALTTDKPLSEKTYLNLPDHRTKSEEITLNRI